MSFTSRTSRYSVYHGASQGRQVFQHMNPDERERMRGLIARAAPEAEIDRAFVDIKVRARPQSRNPRMTWGRRSM